MPQKTSYKTEMNMKANQYLHTLPQINYLDEASKYGEQDVLLFMPNASFVYCEDDLIDTLGLGEKWDKKRRDLIRVIRIIDAYNIIYEKTNILVPLMFAETSEYIPWHLNTQSILFTKVSEETLEWIKQENKKEKYGKHEFDKFWLPFCKNINDLKAGDTLCIFNRRVGGWDGSHERPVIELLGAGGHVPTVWNRDNGKFRELEIKENFQKEFREELGGTIEEEDIVVFGGYQNDATHELVVLCGIEIDDKGLMKMQEYAIQNLDEDTKGIYLGTFKDTIHYYRKNPNPFAGGAKAAPYNFPNQNKLMEKIIKYSEL